LKIFRKIRNLYNVSMNLQEITVVAEKGLLLWRLTDDPMTLSASKILLRCRKLPLNKPEKISLQMLQRQLAAYEVLYSKQLM
jgi:hypothetical protein